METKHSLNRVLIICYLGLSMLLLLLLAMSAAFAKALPAKEGSHQPILESRDAVDRSPEEAARSFAFVSLSSRGELSAKAGEELIRIEIGLKRSTIPDKRSLPLRISLEPAEAAEAMTQRIPRQFCIPPDTEAYTVAARTSSGKPVAAKQIRDTFLLGLGCPKHVKPEVARDLVVSVLHENRWVPLPSRWDAVRRMAVTESASQFGTYRLLARTDVTHQDIIAYPNPVQFGEFGGVSKTMKFLNVPLGSVVEIYTLTGDKIREIEAKSSEVIWNGEKSDGEMITSGLYIYRVQMPGSEAFGKLAVLQ